MYRLKPLSAHAIPAALAKAERYRLLNEPGEAESICLDVLAIEPHHQGALVTLLLALTDQFADGGARFDRQARDLLPRLGSEYERAYYAGIICERRAKAHLARHGPGSGSVAYEGLVEALGHYETAEARRPPGNDDAILRWNACARLLMADPELQPTGAEPAEPLMLE